MDDHSISSWVGLENRRLDVRCLTVRLTKVHAVQEQGMEMRVEAKVGGGPLDDHYRAGLAAGMKPAVPGAHRVREKAQHRAQVMGIECERIA